MKKSIVILEYPTGYRYGVAVGDDLTKVFTRAADAEKFIYDLNLAEDCINQKKKKKESATSKKVLHFTCAFDRMGVTI